MPGKSLARDSAMLGSDKQIFDGDFAKPDQRNSKKISHEDYHKKFTAAEERYVRVLGVLIDEVKKMSGALGVTGRACANLGQSVSGVGWALGSVG